MRGMTKRKRMTFTEVCQGANLMRLHAQQDQPVVIPLQCLDLFILLARVARGRTLPLVLVKFYHKPMICWAVSKLFPKYQKELCQRGATITAARCRNGEPVLRDGKPIFEPVPVMQLCRYQVERAFKTPLLDHRAIAEEMKLTPDANSRVCLRLTPDYMIQAYDFSEE